jgi:hypothetical protein
VQRTEDHQDEPEKAASQAEVYMRPARSRAATPAPPAAGPPVMAPWVPTTQPRPANHRAGRNHRNTEAGPAQGAPRGADLPGVAPRRRLIALCFGLTFLIYLALVPRIILYSSPPTGDQAFYLMVTGSIVEDRDLNIANNYVQREEDKFYSLAPHPPGFVGMDAPYPLNQLLAFSTARPAGEKYDFRMPGLPALIAPAWLIGSWFALWWPATVVFMALLGALVGVNMFLLAYALSGRPGIAWAVWLPLAFSNPVLSYTFLLFTELPTALLVLYAFRRLAHGWGANGPARLLLVGLCIGYIPWMSWRCLPIAAGLALYALVQWWRYYRTPRSSTATPESESQGAQRNNPRISWIAPLVPLAVSAGLLVGYNLFLFGSPIPPNKVPELGDASPFLWPWEGSKGLTNFITTGFALLFDRQAGLLPYAPIYILAVVGLIAMFRAGGTGRRLLCWLAVVGLPYVGLIMSYLLWTGLWGPPARFLTPLLPLLAGPLAVALAAGSRIYKILYAVLALPGIFLGAIMMYDPRLLWPAYPVFGWLVGAPESPLRFDLRPFLPAFSPLDELTLPRDTGWMTLAAVLIILVGYLLLARRPAMPVRPLPFAATGVTWILALALVGAGWWDMNATYLKHRTTLVPQHRWSLEVPLTQPLGITYLNGEIFMADFAGSKVAVLDTRSGTSWLLQPITGTETLNLGRVGDVKAGTDGLLYVLNNGPGAQALLLLRPDGQVVRGEALDGKSDVAVGLSFGPQGKLYVGDMVGGHVREYAATGGPTLSNFNDPAAGFNNLSGVTVLPDGRIYAADVANRQVVQVAPDGHFAQRYPLDCGPWYIAADGDWLEVSCGAGVLSINTQTGTVQPSRVDGDNPQLAAPTGLAFGPDGLLYVLDGATLGAYQVEH